MTDHVLTSRIFICRWLVAAALGVFSLSASADTVPAVTEYATRTATSSANTATGYFSTRQAACSYSATTADSWSTTSAPHTGTVTQPSAYMCYVYTKVSSVSYNSGFSQRTACPANSTLASGVCTCAAGRVAQNGQCVVRDYIKELNESGGAVVGEGTCGIDKCWQSPGGGGLKVRGTGATCWKSKETGKNMFEVYGPFTANGGACTETAATGSGSTPTQPATPSPADCTGYWGSVNGEGRCIPKSGSTGTGTAAPEDKQTTTTDGTGTTTTGTTGSTSCFDGTCTTTRTTTTTPPGGGAPVTTTTTSTQPKVTYCQENPAAAACKAPSECDSNPDSLACLKLGTPDNGVQLFKSDAGFSAITPVSFAAGAGCPADLTFNVNAKPYAISYAPMCNAASTYGAPVVLILGVALAAFIFIGGFKA